MKKKLLLFIFLVMMSNVALASPLMDYSAGKGSIELQWRDAKNTILQDGLSLDYPNKVNVDAAVTLGIGNNFAIQYRNFSPKSDYKHIIDNGGTTEQTVKLEESEFNLLYKLDKNIAVFAGRVNVKGTIEQSHSTGIFGDISIPSESKRIFQVGLVGSTQVADKTNLWGSIGTGSKLTSLEIGVGYEFAPNWEFDVSYHKLTVKEVRYILPVPVPMIENATEGFGLGVTYKF